MSAWALWPFGCGLVAATLAAQAAAGLRAPRAATAGTAVAAGALVMWITALVTMVFGWVSGLEHVVPDLRWVRALVNGRHLEAALGLPAAILLLVAAVRVGRVLVANRRLRPRAGLPDVVVIHDDAPIAVSLPGRHGHVVVSTGMVDRLDETGCRALLAHEAAHRRFRHDRHLVVLAVVDAAIPVAASLTRRVRFALERWADEVAADEVGDRLAVATAIAVAAGARPMPGLANAAGGDTLRRVELLLVPRGDRPRRFSHPTVLLFVGLLSLATAIQLHHLLTYLAPLR